MYCSNPFQDLRVFIVMSEKHSVIGIEVSNSTKREIYISIHNNVISITNKYFISRIATYIFRDGRWIKSLCYKKIVVLGSLITNLNSDFGNSKWRLQDGGHNITFDLNCF